MAVTHTLPGLPVQSEQEPEPLQVTALHGERHALSFTPTLARAPREPSSTSWATLPS